MKTATFYILEVLLSRCPNNRKKRIFNYLLPKPQFWLRRGLEKSVEEKRRRIFGRKNFHMHFYQVTNANKNDVFR